MTVPHRLRAAVAVAALTGLTVISAPTYAQALEVVPDPNPCKVEGWYVNPDETDRAPERTYDGFVFEPADLIHHAVAPGTKLKHLKPGWFTAFPAPDQPSFFSVEVRDFTTDAYGTLRWNKVTAAWTLTTNMGTFTAEDPEEFIGKDTKWGKLTSATQVVSFGVGYTKNPPGTVKTTVKSVTFQKKGYEFTCLKPTTSPTPSGTTSPTSTPSGTPSASATSTPSQSPSSSATATPSRTTSSPSASASSSTSAPVLTDAPDAGGDGSLPVTGASLGLLLAGGAVILLAGVAAVAFSRARRT